MTMNTIAFWWNDHQTFYLLPILATWSGPVCLLDQILVLLLQICCNWGCFVKWLCWFIWQFMRLAYLIGYGVEIERSPSNRYDSQFFLGKYMLSKLSTTGGRHLFSSFFLILFHQLLLLDYCHIRLYLDTDWNIFCSVPL